MTIEYTYWIMQDGEWHQVSETAYEIYSSHGMEGHLTTEINPDPEYLNNDGTADRRKKRVPKEWQEEWK